MIEPSTTRRKMVALVLSSIFPGLGQFYNRQPLKATGFLVAGVVLSWLMGRMVPSDLATLPSVGANLLILVCVLLTVWLCSVIDAWRFAGP